MAYETIYDVSSICASSPRKVLEGGRFILTWCSGACRRTREGGGRDVSSCPPAGTLGAAPPPAAAGGPCHPGPPAGGGGPGGGRGPRHCRGWWPAPETITSYWLYTTLCIYICIIYLLLVLYCRCRDIATERNTRNDLIQNVKTGSHAWGVCIQRRIYRAPQGWNKRKRQTQE